MRKLVKAIIPKSLFSKIEPFGHLLEAVVMNIVLGFPARGMNVIGVTGTDGKTTTTMFIWSLLKEAGYKAGYMTTIGYGTAKYQKANYVHMTTVSSFELLKRIKQMRREGVEWLVLETTSHALAQNRVWGVPYSLAVVTNVAHEHLDYHGSFENYLSAKKKLFSLTARNKRGMQIGIINGDDASAGAFVAEVPQVISYGLGKSGTDIEPTDVKTTPNGSNYLVRRGNTSLHIHVNIPGSFNVYNSLAAVCVGLALDLTNQQIEEGISALKSVEGRMARIDEGQNFTVIVDFAHTPESFKKLLSDMRSQIKPPKRLIVMFGSAGRRDEAKREIQGKLAAQYADIVVLTEEDDRDVGGQQILAQIAGGAQAAGKVQDKDLFLVHNRSEAIKFAISQAKPGDTVMLLGKGHEKTIERADGEHPWNEVGEARQALKTKLG